ncbi:CDP-diacylglycerol diphosphatase [Pseudomonas sp. FP2338]|uniref:CDP-diacylglycerol diphosphatase n=1 Tax=Pseudomonas sp. FP2338 TaxID=2954093 RepID=UPI0027351A0F|nr:CDP-diacylglycerol diphosphatase [Pseudomonas sp. FP2338]WLH87531.1 CDP-diacylglycerol diphosphatase [Pseudomonas sp. FP2338]
MSAQKPSLFVDRGYTLLKDRNGPFQDLLILVDKITGIEDPALGRHPLPHYFTQAWRHRAVLSAGLAKADLQCMPLQIQTPPEKSYSRPVHSINDTPSNIPIERLFSLHYVDRIHPLAHQRVRAFSS